ncbi:hypothetical protein [Demequina pelophila]|uniref:hypothetical protein n=1 Tax=Demequina pelophila TaxID=1638984 RepID=UPI000783DB42|nr:hypothetical protein [Demequina pelophila]
MSFDWSSLLPALIVAIVAGATAGVALDIARRVEEVRGQHRRFDEAAPAALATAQEILVVGLPKDPSSLVPPDNFVRSLREQVVQLRGGSRAGFETYPAIDMLHEMTRLLENLAVRGRAIDGTLHAVLSPGRSEAEVRLYTKLARQAIQKDPRPAEDVPRIESEDVQKIVDGTYGLTDDILKYREIQERLHDARDAFVDHWWAVRQMRLDAGTRLASAGHLEGAWARAKARREIEAQLKKDVHADFARQWKRIEAGVRRP